MYGGSSRWGAGRLMGTYVHLGDGSRGGKEWGLMVWAVTFAACRSRVCFMCEWLRDHIKCGQVRARGMQAGR